ncbi:tetratricopeptide repeat protein [Paenibacillus sp. GCM10023250]|uniref:tetratricopeptide repeat protein n=1 Tax=Paenibacillus sp. GCM10023250 TaxID=3252648 RepID=UPI0036206876
MHAEHFAVLRIEPTSDSQVIKKAYAKLLKLHPPETSPDQFQRIREAYEGALAAAKAGLEATAPPEDPVEAFAGRLKALYDHYPSRIDAAAWKALLDLDVCHHIDTRESVSRKTLDFLTDDYHIPHEVWRALNEHFEWTRDKDKLLEEYNPNFIEFAMKRIEQDHYVHYDELLTCDNGQQDALLGYYYDGMRAIDQYDYYLARESLRQAQAIQAEQSDVVILQARYAMAVGKTQEALESLTALIKRIDGDYYARYYRAVLLFKQGLFEQASQDYEAILPMRPDSADILFSLGQCAVGTGKYTDGIAYLDRLSDILPDDHEVANLLLSAHRYRIDQLSSAAESGTLRETAGFELADSYLAVNMTDEAYRLLVELEQHYPSAALCFRISQALDLSGKRELALAVVNNALLKFEGDADLQYLKAKLLKDLGDLEGAALHYVAAIERAPSNQIFHSNLAYLLNQLNRYEEALERAEQAIAIDSDYPNAYRHKAEALMHMERYEASIEACEAALARNSRYLDAYWVLMQAHMNVANHHSVVEVFNRAAQQELKDPRLTVLYANALRRSEEFEPAIEQCDEVLEENAENGEARLCKLICLFRLRHYREAISEFERISVQQPAPEEAAYYACLSYYNESMPNEAMQLARQILDQGADKGDLFYDVIGDIYRDRGDSDSAIEAYRSAVRNDDNVANYHFQLGHLLDQDDTWTESLQHLNAAIKLEPTPAAYAKKLSLVFMRVKSYAECLNICEKLLDMDPDHSDGYDYMAWSHYMLNNKEQAGSWLKEGLRKHADHVSMLHLKSVLLMDDGHTREALAVCDRILDLDPEHEDTIERRDEILSAAETKKSVFNWFKH